MTKFIEILRFLPIVEAIPYLLFHYFASVIRMFKTKSSNDVSIIAWIVSTVVQYGYILYGILIVKEWQYIFSCLTASTGTTVVLVTAIYYRFRNKNRSKEENK